VRDGDDCFFDGEVDVDYFINMLVRYVCEVLREVSQHTIVFGLHALANSLCDVRVPATDYDRDG